MLLHLVVLQTAPVLLLIRAMLTLLVPLLDQVHGVNDQGTQCQHLRNIELKDLLELLA